MNNTLLRYMLLVFGWLALGLAALGVVLPVLPTTPFVLIAVACFLRSSERLHRWLVTHPVFGEHIQDYFAGKGLQRRTKVTALTMLWASVLASVVLVIPLLPIDLLVIAVAAAVTAYILRLPTAKD